MSALPIATSWPGLRQAAQLHNRIRVKWDIGTSLNSAYGRTMMLPS